MRLRPSLALITLLLPSAALAQISIYATVAPIHSSNPNTGDTTYKAAFPVGFGAGVTLSVLPLGPVTLGIDLRGSASPGNSGADTVLGGLKLSIHPPFLHIKPYIQGSAGYLNVRNQAGFVYVNQSGSNSFLAFEGLGGLDYPLIHFLDLRLVEFGGGQGVRVGSGSGSNVTFYTLNSGLVVHF